MNDRGQQDFLVVDGPERFQHLPEFLAQDTAVRLESGIGIVFPRGFGPARQLEVHDIVGIAYAFEVAADLGMEAASVGGVEPGEGVLEGFVDRWVALRIDTVDQGWSLSAGDAQGAGEQCLPGACGNLPDQQGQHLSQPDGIPLPGSGIAVGEECSKGFGPYCLRLLVRAGEEDELHPLLTQDPVDAGVVVLKISFADRMRLFGMVEHDIRAQEIIGVEGEAGGAQGDEFRTSRAPSVPTGAKKGGDVHGRQVWG